MTDFSPQDSRDGLSAACTCGLRVYTNAEHKYGCPAKPPLIVGKWPRKRGGEKALHD